MSQSAVTMQSLPDELALAIAQELSCIRSYETQSTAFKDRAKEKWRQCENRIRQLALHSLCLTSRWLRGIAVPILYASFCGSLTWYGLRPLQLFHRTITGPGTGVGLRIRYSEYLQYIENRLADHLGNSLHQDSSHESTTGMAASYLHLLAEIAISVPNLEHLTIVSLETEHLSFWSHVIPDGGRPPFEDKASTTSFQKLHSVSLQVHTEIASRSISDKVAWFHSICSAMISVPNLTDLRASGVTSNSWTPSFRGTFKKLQRLEFTECCLDIEDVTEVWTACEGLRHIVCEWAFLIAIDLQTSQDTYFVSHLSSWDCADHIQSTFMLCDLISLYPSRFSLTSPPAARQSKPADLHAALLRHKNTLQTLHLDMREVRADDAFTAPERLGSLQHFTALKSLGICETTLFGHVCSLTSFPDQVLQCRLPELLPANLESFTFLLLGDQAMENVGRLDEPLILWNFADDCKNDFSELKEVRIASINDLHAPKVARALEDTNVQFSLVKESKSDFFGA